MIKLSLWERVKKEKTTCDLADSQKTQLCRGQRVRREQKQEEGRKFATKIPPSPSKTFFKPAGP